MTEPVSNDDRAPSQPVVTADPTPLGGLHKDVLAVAAELAGPQSALAERDGGAGAGGRPGRGAITLERPPRADLGDYSTNAALLLARILDAAPREVAERLGRALQGRLGVNLERFEVAGPGFLN